MDKSTPWAGMFCKDADKDVLVDLDKRGLLFSAPVFEHSYPHCWRCDTPLIYYARDSWFIKMTAVRDDLVRNNNTVNWIPESIGKGRFGDWLENVQDWSISRNRYWGTPLNVWECECGHRHSIGSIEELKSMSSNCPDDIELHRPYIDAVTIKCPKCGGEMHRVPEVIDCWFDSGSMPFAQHHYPFENHDLFEAAVPGAVSFPRLSIRREAGSIRCSPFRPCCSTELPMKTSSFSVTFRMRTDRRCQSPRATPSTRSTRSTPTAQTQSAGISTPTPLPGCPTASTARLLSRVSASSWAHSGTSTLSSCSMQISTSSTPRSMSFARLRSCRPWTDGCSRDSIRIITTVDNYLADYCIPEAARALQNFVDEMSNWYVRRCRERFWAQGMSQDKIDAYMTLYTALVTVSKLAAPMIPFMTEDIYRNLVCSIDKSAPESVHLCDYPVADAAYVDKALEERMNEALNIVVLGRAARNGANIKNRQPLGKMFVRADEALGGEYAEIIKDELNVKELEFVDGEADFVSYSFKPQLKTVGPKYGRFLGKIKEHLASLDGSAAKKELDENGALKFSVDGNEIELGVDDLLIDSVQKEGSFAVSDYGITVAIDTNLTPELIEEGFVREIISKIQTMRKEADFDVMDKIVLYTGENEKLNGIIKKNAESIKHDVLADEIVYSLGGDSSKEWNINGEKMTLGVSKK